MGLRDDDPGYPNDILNQIKSSQAAKAPVKIKFSAAGQQRQRQILAKLDELTEQDPDHLPPNVREIAAVLDYPSHGSVYMYLRDAEDLGLVRRRVGKTAHGLFFITEKGKRHLAKTPENSSLLAASRSRKG